MKEIGKLLKIGDKILIVLIIVLSISWIMYIPVLSDNLNDKVAVVKIKDEVIFKYQINDDVDEVVPFEFEVKGKKYTGYLEIQNGAVRLQRLPEEIVPRGIHNDMGWIRSEYEIIVALPISMTVTIESNQSDNQEIDYIVQ
ncbi:MAG: NusG domain II-containing protein [Tissierellales bacterium]|nr:NusG domain II-containing protein [Tissierellales bacterium]